MSRTVHEAVAAAIRAEMAVQRRSQSDLVDLLGLSQAGISRRMLGQTPLDVNELVPRSVSGHAADSDEDGTLDAYEVRVRYVGEVSRRCQLIDRAAGPSALRRFGPVGRTVRVAA